MLCVIKVHKKTTEIIKQCTCLVHLTLHLHFEELQLVGYAAKLLLISRDVSHIIVDLHCITSMCFKFRGADTGNFFTYLTTVLQKNPPNRTPSRPKVFFSLKRFPVYRGNFNLHKEEHGSLTI